MAVQDENFSRRIGSGGQNAPMEIVTHGVRRMEVEANSPAMKVQPAASTPATPTVAGGGTWFFRDSGNGKAQFCVLFPSGAVQVIATEP